MYCEGSVCPPLPQEYAGNSKPWFPISNTTKLHTAGTAVHTQAALQHAGRLFLTFFMFLLLLLMLYTATFLFVDQEYSPCPTKPVKFNFAGIFCPAFPKFHTPRYFGGFPLSAKALL